MKIDRKNGLTASEERLNSLARVFWSITIFSLIILSLFEWGGPRIVGIDPRYWRLIAEIMSVSLFFVYLTQQNPVKRILRLTPILVSFVVLLLWYYLRIVIFTDLTRPLVSTILMFVFFGAIGCRPWRNLDLRIISCITATLICYLFYRWIIDGMQLFSYVPFNWWNKNGTGYVFALSFPLVCIGRIHSKRKMEWISLTAAMIMCFILLTVSGARTAFISFCVGMGVYWFWPLISRNRSRFIVFGGIFMLLCLIYPFVYLSVLDLTEISSLKMLGYGVTSRKMVFLRSVEFWALSPVVGNGLGTLVPMFDGGASRTPHNTYLFVLVQTGVVGLSVYVYYLWSICFLLFRGAGDPLVRVCGAVFFGLLLYQTNDVVMMVSTLTMSLWAYFILGIGISRADEYRRKFSLSTQLRCQHSLKDSE
ncbi:MAG: O-antigen ligase family protein [Proteobacteria bacterium]|nr:O-antigen ligase family protein [Pseudomonadota bacterium]